MSYNEIPLVGVRDSEAYVKRANDERMGHEAYGDESGERSRITWKMTMKQQSGQFQVWENISAVC